MDIWLLPEKGRGLFHANYPVGWVFMFALLICCY
jgi:hypothetical protein